MEELKRRSVEGCYKLIRDIITPWKKEERHEIDAVLWQ